MNVGSMAGIPRDWMNRASYRDIDSEMSNGPCGNFQLQNPLSRVSGLGSLPPSG